MREAAAKAVAAFSMERGMAHFSDDILVLLRALPPCGQCETHVWVPRSELLGALARGYCAESNTHKTLDPQLLMAQMAELTAMEDK